MRSILILICVVVFIQDFTQGRLVVNNDGIVGVSQQKLKDYMVKAIKGFRKIMLEGEKDLGYPVMDPYEVVDASWDLIDKSISKKYSLNFINKNKTIIKGLANYEATNVEASAKDMRVSFMLTHGNISTKFPYKLDGYLLKNFMPVFGDGFIEFSTPSQVFQVDIDLGLEQGYVIVEKVKIDRLNKNIDVKVTNLMDLPDPFASAVLDDILDDLMKKNGDKVLNAQAHILVEEAVGGMTLDELFEYLDHLGEKSEE